MDRPECGAAALGRDGGPRHATLGTFTPNGGTPWGYIDGLDTPGSDGGIAIELRHVYLTIGDSHLKELEALFVGYGYKPYWETGVLAGTEKEKLGETESERMARIEEKAEPKKEEVAEEEAKVEPIHPSENRGGKKRSLLDTCK